jgi:hypothetical protein
MQTTVDLLPGNRHHEAEVRFDEILLGAFGFLLGVTNYREGVLQLFEICEPANRLSSELPEWW